MTKSNNEDESVGIEQSVGRPFRTCLMGASLDCGNMGVRALAASLIRLVLKSQPNAQITLLYGNREGGVRSIRVGGGEAEVQIVNYRLSPRAQLAEFLPVILLAALLHRTVPLLRFRKWLRGSWPWLRTLHEADFVGDIRGGDSFSDIYGLKRFLGDCLPSLSAILMNQRLVLLPQTYGPYRTYIARRLARWIMTRANVIYARDKTSHDVARDLLGEKADTGRILLCPDVAFSLEAHNPQQPELEPSPELDGPGPLVGINLSGLLYMGGYTGRNMFGLKFEYREFAKRLLRAFLRGTDARILLVPHTFGNASQNDFDVARETMEAVGEECDGRVWRVARQYDQCELKGLIGRCDFFVGSRMHSCIAALSQGIPSVGVAYSRKFAGVYELAGVADLVLEARELEAEALIEACLDRYDRRSEYTERLNKRLPELLNRLNRIFKTRMRESQQDKTGAFDKKAKGTDGFGTI